MTIGEFVQGDKKYIIRDLDSQSVWLETVDDDLNPTGDKRRVGRDMFHGAHAMFSVDESVSMIDIALRDAKKLFKRAKESVPVGNYDELRNVCVEAYDILERGFFKEVSRKWISK